MIDKGKKPVTKELLAALDMFERSQRVVRPWNRKKFFIIAVRNILEEAEAIEPHITELIKILQGEYGDATPGSLGLFCLRLLRDYPMYPDKVQRRVNALVNKVDQVWDGKSI